jgi:hypothetical protein
VLGQALKSLVHDPEAFHLIFPILTRDVTVNQQTPSADVEYRGVIREQDIVACCGGQVTFRYRHAKTGRMEQRMVAGADFLWLVLQHVLPKGFRRARNFGFLHPN